MKKTRGFRHKALTPEITREIDAKRKIQNLFFINSIMYNVYMSMRISCTGMGLGGDFAEICIFLFYFK